ncbi:MAG: protein jag [Dehalococcoidia bacterium]|nr:protein jag [Dehalococcoidia bacterium]
MRELEASARTVEEAIQKALAQMGLTLDDVEIEVLGEGRTGVLGIGGEPARVRVIESPNRIPPEELAAARAQECLDALLYLMGIDAGASVGIYDSDSFEGEDTGASVVLDIRGSDLGLLIGRHGQTLASLQYILRLIVGRQAGVSVPLVLDVNGYKRRRFESLRTLAQHVAEQVEVNGRSFALEPMPAYERRIIHLALADHSHVITESVGFGDDRKVVVVPR